MNYKENKTGITYVNIGCFEVSIKKIKVNIFFKEDNA